MRRLIALLKAGPGAYNYGSSGNGKILHLAAEIMDEAGSRRLTSRTTAWARC